MTVPETVRGSLEGQLRYVQQYSGCDVIVVSSPGDDLDYSALREGVQGLAVRMEREVSPWRDVVALYRLWRMLVQQQPGIVIAGTPKAALLGMLASWFARVPRRIYLLKGLRLATTVGIKRKLLVFAERLASHSATEILCVSDSLRKRYAQLRLADPSKLIVLGNGTSNGVCANRFDYQIRESERTDLIRKELDIPLEATVLGFVGRLVRDKGIANLVACFKEIVEARPDAYLLVLGKFEELDRVNEEDRKYLAEHPNVRLVGFRRDMEVMYAVMDVLLFPTYREGFPKAPLEAALMNVPTVAFDVDGCTDAIQHGVTGMLVPFGDQMQFNNCVMKYVDDSRSRLSHGVAGRQWVLENFHQDDVWRNYVDWFVGVEPVSKTVSVSRDS
ncbi:glycosyltransferase family 4 protein [Rosistilla ulvae]|nr:glycosyltransferase family 4 protein [Rosistilla ulvae]